ncbi:MAG: DUF1648 domain-containing protein [Lachnospiraceae bacterium]|nr:DUF1648 domain-containing protein [Lachnospiraceae bacterium]
MKNRAYIMTHHRIIEAVGLAMTLAGLIVGIVFAVTATGDVPIHFGLNGEVDKWGSAWEGISLPIILFITNIGMSLMIRFVPLEHWNMPCNVTENNAPVLYRNVLNMVVLMILCFGLMSLLGTVFMYKARNLMGPAIVGACALMMVITTYYLIKCVIDSKRYV